MHETKSLYVARGQIWWVNSINEKSLEGKQNGDRPYLIVSSDKGNATNSTYLGVAITSNNDKSSYPINVAFENIKNTKNTILCNQIRTIQQSELRRYYGVISSETMSEVEESLAESLGFEHRIQQNFDLDMLKDIVCRITEKKIEDYQKKSSLSADMALEIAAGLEEIYAKELKEKNPTSSVIDLRKGSPDRELLMSKEFSEFHAAMKKKNNAEGNLRKNPSDNTIESSNPEKKFSIDTKYTSKKSIARKPKGFWTEERSREYIEDKDRIPLDSLMQKWGLSDEKTAIRLYYNLKSRIKKND